MDNKKIEKLKKILELSKNNSSKNESEIALLKAHKLMEKENISIETVNLYEYESDRDKINIESVTVSKRDANKWWISKLLSIVSNNFRCKTYCNNDVNICFYGYETDVNIARETFIFLKYTAEKLAKKEYQLQYKKFGTAKGVIINYINGFLDGVNEKLSEQSQALMIIISEKVKDEYAKFSANFGTQKTRAINIEFDEEIYYKGKVNGKNAIVEKDKKYKLCI